MSKNIDIFEIKSGINKQTAEFIINSLDSIIQFESAGMRASKDQSSPKIDLNTRNCKIGWIDSTNWISGMLFHFINCANNYTFNYDLDWWANPIQYTLYEGKGTRYNWHIDTHNSLYKKQSIRKLSISACLSSKDDYDGGELQIQFGTQMKSYKMDCGDVIVFPSDLLHRVRPLKSGKRISLVGWYGGPKFK